MSAQTEANLKNWGSGDTYLADDIHVHFEDFARWDWCEVYQEGCRVYELMFDQHCGSESAIGELMAGIAAQASNGAFAGVAACLGVDVRVLRNAVADWYESQDKPPAPVGLDGLKALMVESQAFVDELDHGEFDRVDGAVSRTAP